MANLSRPNVSRALGGAWRCATSSADENAAAFDHVTATEPSGEDPEALRGRSSSAPRIKEEARAPTIDEILEMKQADSKRLMQETVDPKDWKFKEKWDYKSSMPTQFRLYVEPEAQKTFQPKGTAVAGQSKAGSPSSDKKHEEKEKAASDYSKFAGLRFPTLETAQNYDYFKDRGLERVAETRVYPIKVPAHRRIDPYLREYIHFLAKLDPARFTYERIAERYRLKVGTVRMIVKEWAANEFLTRSCVQRLREKQTTKEAVVLDAKEKEYAKWVGYDQIGDADDPDTDDEELGTYKGWRSTFDWVQRQQVEVEMMSAFPMSEKRDPMPKRVDVDMVVENRRYTKVINWIDPLDKVVF